MLEREVHHPQELVWGVQVEASEELPVYLMPES